MKNSDYKKPGNDSEILLSLIICSRNDQYMGNSRWRLETSLNYVAARSCELGLDGRIEVLVADWGSETPLEEEVHLTNEASKIVTFILIPPKTARSLQRDSPFPEVLALNTAARRARGKFVGRIDQDTLVGKRFLAFFIELCEGKNRFLNNFDSMLFFSNQRMVPYWFTVKCPGPKTIDRFVSWFGSLLILEFFSSRADFYSAGVGIWLLPRALWIECGGYDERMIYMNAMETNMIRRLKSRYELVDLGKLVNYDFYHLEHYHPGTVRKSSTHRRVNPPSFLKPESFHPNDSAWGLADYLLHTGASKNITEGAGTGVDFPSLVLSAPLVVLERIRVAVNRSIVRWRKRTEAVGRTIKGQSLFRWPYLLKQLWSKRNSRIRSSSKRP